MRKGEHSAILLTFIKLQFVIKIFVLFILEWLFYTGFTECTNKNTFITLYFIYTIFYLHYVLFTLYFINTIIYITLISSTSSCAISLLIYRKTLYTEKPVSSRHSKPKIGFQYRLWLNAGQKYCRMHSAILLTFIKLPFVFKTFVLTMFEWPLKTGFTVYSL